MAAFIATATSMVANSLFFQMTPLHQALHEELVVAANRAANTGRATVFGKIVERLKDGEIRRQVLFWIERYTVATVDLKSPSQLTYSREKKLVWNASEAVANPFWVFAKVRHSVQRRAQPQVNEHETNYFRGERDIAKQHLRTAMSRFLVHPSYANKENLVSLLTAFQNKFVSSTDPSFIKVSSGGLPSLGKSSR